MQAQKKNNMREMYKGAEENQKTVFFKGLPPFFQKQDLLDILPNPAEVLDVRIIKKPNATTQIAYVDFTNKDQAELATSINKQNLDGYNVAAAISKPPESYANDRTVLISKLPHQITNDQLHRELKFCKEDLETVRIHKSAAHLIFKSIIAAKKHLKRLKNMEMGSGQHRRRIIAVYQGEKQVQQPNHVRKGSDASSSHVSEIAHRVEQSVVQPVQQEETGKLGKRMLISNDVVLQEPRHLPKC